jgi:hypothetical protein
MNTQNHTKEIYETDVREIKRSLHKLVDFILKVFMVLDICFRTCYLNLSRAV